MQIWLQVTLMISAIILFFIFVLWADWKLKCRKTIKENKLDYYLKGYGMFDQDCEKPVLAFLSGLLGVNSKELVFCHRFKNDVINIKYELTDIDCFEVHEYNESDFIALLKQNYGFQEGEVKYCIINMAGLSTTKKIPKLVKKRRLCKIGIKTDSDLYFYYEDSPETANAINEIQKYISQ